MPDPTEPPDRPVPPPPREAVQRWRLEVARSVLEAGAGQREQLAAWERALAASGLPVAGLDGTPPRARVAVAAPLGPALRGEAELVDTWLAERLPVWRVREALAAAMPAGHRLVAIHDVWLGEPPLPGRVTASVYRAELVRDGIDPHVLGRACRALLDAASIPRDRPKGDGVVRYDLRPFVDDLVAADDGTWVRMTLRHDPERGIGRPDEVIAALSEAAGEPLSLVTLVRERLLLAQPPPPTLAAPRSGVRGRTGRDSRPGRGGRAAT